MAKPHSYKELEGRIKYLEQELYRLRHKSEEVIREENEDRYKTLAEAAQEGIFILENGCCIEANKNGCQMFGYTYEEIIGRLATSVFVPEDQEMVKQNIISGKSDPYEALAVRKDGTRFFAEIKGKNFTFKGRKVRVTSVVDITNRKRAEQRLIESESKYREVIENAADGILIGNLRGEIVDVNKGFLKMTGYCRTEVLNKHISFLFDPKVLAEKPLRFDLLNKGQSIIVERDIIDKNGKLIPIEMNSKRPHANYYLAIIRDLRERRKAEENLIAANKELLEAKERAEESDRLKSAFLANMSHEIRTPMNGIIGFTELLRNPGLSDEERGEHLNVVISSGHQLLNIINDILEISRIETGQVGLTKKQVNVDSVLKSLYLFFKPMVADTGNKLTISVNPRDLGVSIYTDEGKV
ncbi:PAS domain S-box protein, partial [Marinilabilia sp.]